MAWLYGPGCGEYRVAAEMPYYGVSTSGSAGRVTATDSGLVYEYWRLGVRQYQAVIPAPAAECSPGDLAADYWAVAWAVVAVCVLAFGVNHCLRRFVGS